MKKYCSPLLNDAMTPLEILHVVHKHVILQMSESLAFHPLRDRGWAEYRNGRWYITEDGKAQIVETEESGQSLNAFFGVD